MALKIKTEGETRRSDVFWVSPYDIVVKEEYRGRSRPPTEEQIIERAQSLLDHTQLQDVEVRRVDSEGTMVLTLGFTRVAAARLIREGFVGLDGVKRHKPDFLIRARVVDCNEEQAFRRNIVENCHRNETSPMDDAINQDKLRQQGMNDTEIAALYGERNSNRVGKLRKLLLLAPAVQELVHLGKMGVDPAVKLLDLPEDQRQAAVAEAITDGDKIDGSVITAQVRAHHLNDDNGSQTPSSNGDGEASPRKAIALSMREVRKYFEGIKTNEENDPAIVRFASDTLLWLTGKRSEKTMSNALDRLLDAKRGK